MVDLGSEDREVTRFYDDLAADYHLIYADWHAALRRHGHALDRIVTAELGPGPHRILDCSSGIGTQAFGLAFLGHHVSGLDISPRAVQKAREEARRLQLPVEFEVGDLRALKPDGNFDVVLSCDNSLPHLLSERDLERGISSMLGALRKGGLFVASIRDYDAILQDRPISTPPSVHRDGESRRVVFQLWDWAPDGRIYELEHFLGVQRDGVWEFRTRRVRYRAVLRSELRDLLEQQRVAARWLLPHESGFFQPVIVGVKP